MGKSTWSIEPGNPGVRGTVGHQGTILNSNGHLLDAGAFASKNFKPSGPVTVGGNVGYTHTPSGSNLSVGANHTRGYGTDVSAAATANIWKSGASSLDAVGSYGRHYGGPSGTSKPNYGGGIQFSTKF